MSSISSVVQVTDGDFPKPLAGPHDFRLLYLPFEADKQSNLEVTLADVSLPAPKDVYDVLSYRWGSGARDSVRCNGRSMSIPLNAADALRTLRGTGAKVLWVDSICISQENLSERNNQMRLMGDIMRMSRLTIVWMGPESEHTGEAFELIQQLIFARQAAFKDTASTPLARTMSMSVIADYLEHLPSAMSRSWKHLDEILDNCPFANVWVLQDIVFSNSLEIYFGSCSMSWVDVCYGLEAYATIGCPNMLRSPVAYTMLALCSLHRESLAGVEIHLSNILEVIRPLRATDNRDKVFAAYTCATALSPLHVNERATSEIDYSGSVGDVYLMATQLINKCAEEEKYLSLSIAGDFDNRKISDLPSWVPDWTTSLQNYRLNSRENEFCATGNLSEELFASYGPTLSFTGCVVDTIAYLSSYLPPRHPCDKLDISGANNIIFSEWYDWAEAKAGAGRFRNDQRNSILLRWTETITAKGSRLSQECLEPIVAEKDSRGLEKLSRRWLDYLETEGAEETDDLRLFYSACLVSHGRRFGLSKRGQFCLLPKAAKPLDLVCIPYGSKVPFVFRPSHAEGQVSYGNIGECYIHGAMFGEALEWDDIEHAKTFHIR